MIISAKPFINFKHLLKAYNGAILHPWKDCVFFKNGTQALISVLRLLDLPIGSKIAIPAYICRTIPNALRSHGFEPCFFDVPLDLKVSSKYLEKTFINEEISVFLLVDFFGFLSQENIDTSQELCKKGYKVIIDRCHSGITNRDYKEDLTKASAVIFSLRKTFNTIDGGAYITNTNHHNNVNKANHSISISFLIARLIEFFVCRVGWPNIYSNYFDKYKKDSSRDNIKVEQNHKNSYYLHRQISDYENINNIADSRIKNYNKLRLIFKKNLIKTLFKISDKYTVPQILPIIDETSELKNYLRINGIGAYSWPDHEIDSYVSRNTLLYPNTLQLNKEILCVPVHQSLKISDIEYINQKLKIWNAKNNE